MPRRRVVRDERPSPEPVYNSSDDSMAEFIDDDEATDDQSSNTPSDSDINSDMEALEYTLTSQHDQDEDLHIEVLNDSGHPESSSNSPESIFIMDEPGPSHRMPAGRPRRSTSRGRGRGRGGRTSGAAAEMTPSTSTTSPTENATEEIPNKRIKLEDDPVTVPFNDSPFNDENNGCPICFDDYAQTGEHRLVTLKCGHLFGKSCIERWIKTEKIEQCPTCKKKAKAADIIAIFIPSGVLGDDSAKTTQLQAQIKALEQDKERMKKQMEEALAERNDELTKKTEEIEQLHILYKVPEPDKQFVLRFVNPRSIVASAKKVARSFDFSSEAHYIVTTFDKPMGTKQCGIQKYSLNSNNSIEKMFLHEKNVRCVQACSFNPRFVASVSEDRTLCVRNVETNEDRFTTKLPHDCWTLCWETDAKLIVGLRNGIFQRIKIGDKNTEELGDLSKPITSVAFDSNHRVIFVASVSGVYSYRNSNITDLTKERIKTFYYDQKMSCFLLTVDSDAGVQLLLYKVSFEGSLVKATKIREHVTNMKTMTQLTTNLVWTTDSGHIVCAYYDAVKKHVRTFNWGLPNDPAFLSFIPCNEKSLPLKEDTEPVIQISFMSRTTQAGPTAPDGIQNTLMALTKAKLHMWFVLYTT